MQEMISDSVSVVQPANNWSSSADYTFEGHIDFYGHHTTADGWIIGGWISTDLIRMGPPNKVVLNFDEEQIDGKGYSIIYYREDVGERGSGLIMFVPTPRANIKYLVSVEMIFADFEYILRPTPEIQNMQFDELLTEVKSIIFDIALDPKLKAGLLNALRETTENFADQWHAGRVASKILGFVDGLDGSYLEGWAIARPDVSDCVVEVTDLKTGETLGRGRAIRDRTDLKNLMFGRSNFGFRIRIKNPADNIGDVRVTADNVELRGSPVPIDQVRFSGALQIEGGCAQGWVVDAFRSVLTPIIRFQDNDGCFLGETIPALPSPDSELAYFSFPLPISCYGMPERVVCALIGDREIARAQCDVRLDGYLDELSPYRCAGWLLAPNVPGSDLSVEIVRNGEVVGSGRCDVPRPDLRNLHPLNWRAGFDISFVPPHNELAPAQLSVRLANSNVELFGGPFIVGKRAGVVQAAQIAARIANTSGVALSAVERALVRAAMAKFCHEQRHGDIDYIRLEGVSALAGAAAVSRRLNIVIPVYRGVAMTKSCIDSVLKHRQSGYDSIVLVNDCSPEPEMARLLESYLADKDVFVLTNLENQGFLRSVNRALDFCRDGDVVLLNSDTTVFDGGFDELFKMAHSSDAIATVTAISNNATIFTYPHPDMAVPELQDISWEVLASAALRENSGLTVDVPTGHGFCLLMKREVLDRIGRLNEIFGRGYGEENEWCGRASDLGYRHVAAAGVFVEHRESASFGNEKWSLLNTNLSHLSTMRPEYMPIIQDYIRRDELRRARWKLDGYRLRKANSAGTSFALVIENLLGHGTGRAVADLENAVGYGDATKLLLVATEDGEIRLEAPALVLRAVFRSTDIDALFEILDQVKVQLVVVHQLLGFSDELIHRLGRYVADKLSIYYIHDFYSFCPRVTTINAVGEFCNGPEAVVCRRCLALDGPHSSSNLKNLTPEAHRDLFRDFMKHVTHIVAPSKDTVERIESIFPQVTVSAIPHPQSFSHFRPDLAEGSYDNIIVLGAIGPHKGSEKLLEIARRARLSHPALTFHVLGYSDMDEQLLAIGNVLITGAYGADELPDLIKHAGGRIALFLHNWPETFSYTLSEAVEHGLIPMVPDIGAPAARVRAAEFGIVYPFPIDAVVVLNLIRQIAAGEVDFGSGKPTNFATPLSATAIADLFTADNSGEAYKRGAVDPINTSRNSHNRPRRKRPQGKR